MKKMRNFFVAFLMMTLGVFTVSAESVASDQWTESNFYLLQTTDGSCLSLYPTKADSLVLTTLPTAKLSYDYALWQITKGTTSGAGTLYRFVNKKTKATLTLAATRNAAPVLAKGINEWSFGEGGAAISSYYSDGDSIIALKSDKGKLSLEAGDKSMTPTTQFTVVDAGVYELSPNELGEGFRTAYLTFGGTFEGNVFDGHTLIATSTADEGHKYMTLQYQDEDAFKDGTPMYLGVDTTRNEITDATGVYGAKFAADSTYTINEVHTIGNADFQKFYFRIDLKNDSIAMFVKDAPTVQEETLASYGHNVQVVYATLNTKKVLTVGEIGKQGVAPLITSAHGEPATISDGSGVYFLKSASLSETNGKYIVAFNGKIITTNETPDVNHALGQWIVKENDGKYSIVDRNTNTALITNGEIFSVNGMDNTFTFGDLTDSITVEYQKNANLKNRFLGTRRFSASELADNVYRLNVYSGTIGIKDVYVFSEDSVLMVNAGDSINATQLRLKLVGDSIQNTGFATGALALGDTLFHAAYYLQERISDLSVTKSGDSQLKLSGIDAPLAFVFTSSANGSHESLYIPSENKYVGMNVTTGYLEVTSSSILFNFVAASAPSYLKIAKGYYSFMGKESEKYLTMNPNSLFAELKSEGQEIATKANYGADDFALNVVPADTVVEGKPMYFIYTAHADTANTRYYLTSLRDTVSITDNGSVYYRLGFVKADSVQKVNNPAMLFAFRALDNGDEGYLLENQMETARKIARTPYLGSVNDNAVLTSSGIALDINPVTETAKEEVVNNTPVTLKVYGGNGTITVDNAAGKKVMAYNILGKVISNGVVRSSHYVFYAPKGVAIVAVEGQEVKKIVVH